MPEIIMFSLEYDELEQSDIDCGLRAAIQLLTHIQDLC